MTPATAMIAATALPNCLPAAFSDDGELDEEDDEEPDPLGLPLEEEPDCDEAPLARVAVALPEDLVVVALESVAEEDDPEEVLLCEAEDEEEEKEAVSRY